MAGTIRLTSRTRVGLARWAQPASCLVQASSIPDARPEEVVAEGCWCYCGSRRWRCRHWCGGRRDNSNTNKLIEGPVGDPDVAAGIVTDIRTSLDRRTDGPG